MARKAEVIYVGDASSIVRASAEAKAAIDSTNSSADKSSASLGGMSTKMKLLGGAVTVAAAALPALAGGIAAISGAAVGLGAVAGGVAVLAAGFTELDKTNKSFAASLKSTLPDLKAMFAQAAQPLLGPAQQVLKELPGLIKQVTPALHSLFAGAATMVQPLANGIVSLAKVALPQLGSILKASAGLIKPLTTGFADFIKILGPVLTQTIKAVTPIMAPLIKGLGGMLGGLMTGVNAMLKALGPAIGPLAAVFAQIGKTIGNVFVTLAPALKPATAVLSSLLSVVNVLFTAFGKIADTLAGALAPAMTTLVPLLAKFVTQLVTNLSPFLQPILKAFTDLVNIALKTMITVLDALLPSLTKIVTTFVKDLAPVLPQLVKMFGQLVTIGVQVLSKALIALTPVFVKLINQVIVPLTPLLRQMTPQITKIASLFGQVLLLAVKALIPILNGVVTAIGFVDKAIVGIDAKAGPALKSVVSAFSTAWNSVSSTTTSVWDGIKKWLVGAWDDITGTISTFASDVENGVISAFDGAANAVIGFVNDIIKAINLIPGVPNIGTIAPIGTGGGSSTPTPAGAGGFALGGKIDKPMFMVGEEAPRHPEFVLATNPAYRKRNLGLWAQAGSEMGVPGFAIGGIVGSIGHDIGSAASSVGSTVSGIAGKILSGGASAITGLLPGVGSLPGWLGGMGSSVLGDVTGWIKNKIGSVVKTIGSTLGLGGGGGSTSAPGGVANWLESAMKATGVSGNGWLSMLERQAMRESTDNPRAINNWDINAKEGNPSEGLLQVTLSNFAEYGPKGGNILNPVDNAIASIKYIIATYGGGNPATALQYMISNGGAAYAQGGTPGLADDQGKISKAFSTLNSLMGPSGDYNSLGEKISYYPSLWQNSNSLLGSGASSFITTTDAQGNSINPFIDTSGLNLTTGEENQELGWYGSQIADIRKTIKTSVNIAPIIRDAIKRLQQQIAAVKAAAKMQIDAITNQINENLQAIKSLTDSISKHPKSKSVKSWKSQIATLKGQNKNLGGTETTVGSGGQIGSVNTGSTNQITALQKQITNMQTNLGNVTGSGTFSPLTLQGITGFGGSLGPDLLQQASLNAELASISPASISAALSSAQASYTPTTSTTAASPTSFSGPTTSQELADLLNGMPALAPGGGRAAGGPVQPGYVYRVGEYGPEDVAFGASGHVMTAAQTRAGGGSMMHIEHAHFSGTTAAKATVDRLAYRASIGVA